MCVSVLLGVLAGHAFLLAAHQQVPRCSQQQQRHSPLPVVVLC